MEPARARRRLAEDDRSRRPAPRPLRVVGGPSSSGTAPPPRPATRPDPGRRTIQITTAGAPPTRRQRRPRPAASRAGGRPDRLALWAVLLALFLAVVAAASGRADDSESGGGGPSADATPVVAPR